MIEKGRHAKPNKIIREERFCYFCKDKIEDEEHFLISCPFYTRERETMENKCNKICTRYQHFTNEQKFIFIMSNENDEIINSLSKFVYNASIMREKIVSFFYT